MIGPAIKWHLEANGWTQYKLAEWMMVNRSVIHKLCSDESNPKYSTIKRVSKIINVSIHDIVNRAEILRQESNSKNNQGESHGNRHL